MVLYFVNKLDELKEISKNHDYLILDFYAEWCGPCKKLLPIFEEYSNLEKYSNFAFVKINVDKDSEISDFYSITGLPTILIMNNELKILNTIIGFCLQKFVDSLDNLIINKKEEEKEIEINIMNNGIFENLPTIL